ncbi:uncharacterized protein LOC125145657 [Tachysurus ichikawai]
MKATSNEAYKKVYRSTFGKCSALWNKCGKSTIAAETVEDACSFQLLRPNSTMWNFLFLAVERLLGIIKEKGEGTIRVICTDLKLPMFNPAELAFLAEYAAVMSPVTQATNILQAEANAMMGWLLPTINLLTVKLDKVKLPLKVLQASGGCSTGGNHEPFWPHVRRTRVNRCCDSASEIQNDEATIKPGTDFIRQHLEEPSLQIGNAIRSTSSEEDDFFSALQSSQIQEGAKQLDGPRRVRLNSGNFENQLLLKMNRHLFSFN